MYKTKEDVLRVISKQKPDRVIDVFIQSYLLGEALQPYLDAEEEYAQLKVQEDVPDVEPLLDPETQEVLKEGYSPNALRDARIAELEAAYPYLADEEVERPVPVVDVEQWKVENYEVLRAAAYPSFMEYIDGIVKEDPVQQQAYIDQCKAVKAKYKKGVTP